MTIIKTAATAAAQTRTCNLSNRGKLKIVVNSELQQTAF